MHEQQKAVLLASRPPASPPEGDLPKENMNWVQPGNGALMASSQALQELMEANAADVPSLRYVEHLTTFLL
jgi:hypothetical protein